jgi:hypothetical protein
VARAVSSALAQEREEEAKPEPSGRLLLRMPRGLHAELSRSAEREGVSLNAYITSALARAVGWGDGDAPAGPDVVPRTPRQARLVVIALFANVVVIGLAAVAAIVLLLLAWRG